eukprot:gene3515-4016_t
MANVGNTGLCTFCLFSLFVASSSFEKFVVFVKDAAVDANYDYEDDYDDDYDMHTLTQPPFDAICKLMTSLRCKSESTPWLRSIGVNPQNRKQFSIVWCQAIEQQSEERTNKKTFYSNNFKQDLSLVDLINERCDIDKELLKMALEDELAELDAVLGDMNSMMKDLNVQSVLEFFPTNNNNETFKDIINAEMDADGPAGRLLRSLSKDASSRALDMLNTSDSSTTRLLSTSSYPSSEDSCQNENLTIDTPMSMSSSSISYDDNIVDLASGSEGDCNTRPNSVYKIKVEDYDSPDGKEGKPQLHFEDQQTENCTVTPVKVSITVFYQKRSFDLEMFKTATAKDLARRVLLINRLQDSQDWTIFEYLPDHHLERNLEDHEVICDVMANWPSRSKCFLQLRNFATKYEFFAKPSLYKLDSEIDNEELTRTNTLISDNLRKCSRTGAHVLDVCKIPSLENSLHTKTCNKKSWSKKYCFLRDFGIYSTGKSKTKRSSKDLKCKVDFSNSILYTTLPSFTENHKPPTEHCFCFTPTTITDQKEIKCFCAEDEQTMLNWIVGFRLAKFGSKLYKNYKLATQDKRAIRTVSAPVNMDTVVRRKRASVDHRVPLDFSGNESRVVSDPAAARALRETISAQLPKRLKRRSTGSYHSPYASGIPTVLEKPWFHGKLEREDAIKRLRSNGMDEGLFLVRESCTSAGVHVISVVKKKKIIHQQIFKAYGEGQIFYGLEHGPRFQSIEQLIEFYQSYKHAGKPSLLKKPCKRPEKLIY